MMRMTDPGGRGVWRRGRWVGGEGQRGLGGLGVCSPVVFSGLLGARGRYASFSLCFLGRDRRWWDWGGLGFEEGLCSLLAGVSQRGLRRCLHGRLRLVWREFRFPYRLPGVCGPWQCQWAVVERAVEVVVPHYLCLPDPGLRGSWCVWTVGGSLGSVERHVGGLPRGAICACDSGGLEESLPVSWRVLSVYFPGVGLGRHEDFMCPVEDQPLGVRFEDVDGGMFGWVRQGCPVVRRLFPFWRG